MSKVFGITKFPNEEAGQVVYLVWSAPAPADDTEPEYVKPLHIRFTLAAAQRMLHSEESKYAEELAENENAEVYPFDNDDGRYDDDPSPYAGDYSEQ